MVLRTAQEYARLKNWRKATETYTKFLKNKNNSAEQILQAYAGRSECYFNMKNYIAAISDCRTVIRTSPNKNDFTVFSARKKLMHALYLLNKYSDSESAAREWINNLQTGVEKHEEIKAILDGMLRFFNARSKQKLYYAMKVLDTKLPLCKNNPMPVNKMEQAAGSSISCTYCKVHFTDTAELRAHCQTESHEMVIMSDEGQEWRWRPPPRGFKSDNYTLCQNWKEMGTCRFGLKCVQAHGKKELAEWKERFRFRESKLKKAIEKELLGKSYTEQLLDKWAQCPDPENLMRDHIDDVQDKCSAGLSVTVSYNKSCHNWTFSMKTRKPLKAVALLQDAHRSHFFISNIFIKNTKVDLKNDQEWITSVPPKESYAPVEYRITIGFKTTIFGTFRQSVVFDFNTEPVLVKHICVELVPNLDMEKLKEPLKEVTISGAERWSHLNCDVVFFRSDMCCDNARKKWELKLMTLYPCIQRDSPQLSQTVISQKTFNATNYRERMHALLFIEEMARYNLISQYNLTTRLNLAQSYILSPNSVAASTAKFSNQGELFASIKLTKELCEDTSEGRLILMHCNAVLLCPVPYKNGIRRKVYEALIEDKTKDDIYLRISKDTVDSLGLKPDSMMEFQIQFQLNRIPYCEWHFILDTMKNIDMLFPDVKVNPAIPWSPLKQWSTSLDSKLNTKQKEAVLAITAPLHIKLPPILVIGPFGTGKTFTLAQAIKTLIKTTENRILLCTHSNSAADLYIKDYFDEWVNQGEEEARPLRIYYQKRWVTTVNLVVQKYCLFDTSDGIVSFGIPTIEDLRKHKIVVVTLSTSIYLSSLNLPPGFFTHILLDEAAQAIECETITPLALANEDTRVVLAGDHMQLGPDIFSTFAKERSLHISLLERLYYLYPNSFSCKILLCENYRAHECIINFISETFYDQKLVSSSKQPSHTKYFPICFNTTRGEDMQDKNSTAFYNLAEVYEVVERIIELKATWSENWGPYDDQSIGVVTPYSDQVFRIRAELKKRRIDNVCVERVLNVQGKQFRAIIISTVRTRKTCTNNNATSEILDYGFLSNAKLLNTAMTRAQSLVAVVGDPIALSTIGRCSKVWERFIQICHENNSLYGITWTQFKLQLDAIELKKIYTLNPLAPEFVPRFIRETPFQSPMVHNIPQIASYNIKDIFSTPNLVPPPPPPPPMVPPQVTFHLTETPFGLAYRPYILAPARPPPAYLFNPPVLPHPMTSLPPHAMTNGLSTPIRYHQPVPAHFIPSPNQRNTPTVQPSTPSQPPPPPPPPVSTQSYQPPKSNNGATATVPISQAPSRKAPSVSPAIPKTIVQNSNKLIQFMNNVHFPEVSVLNDCVNLLPRNMSLADMLLQPPTLQESWYNYLKESTGMEAAEKFKYLLHTTNQKGSKVQDRLIFECTTPQSCDSPVFNWYDSPTNQININKPIYIQSEHAANNTSQGGSDGVNINNFSQRSTTTTAAAATEKLPPATTHNDSSSTNNSIVDSILEVDETDLKHILEEFSKCDVYSVSDNSLSDNLSEIISAKEGFNEIFAVDESFALKYEKYFH